MNAKQTQIVDQLKALSNAFPRESSVEVREIEGLQDVIVQLSAKGSGVLPSSVSATFALGARGGIKHAKFNYFSMVCENEYLSGKAAEEKIKNAEIWIFSKY